MAAAEIVLQVRFADTTKLHGLQRQFTGISRGQKIVVAFRYMGEMVRLPLRYDPMFVVKSASGVYVDTDLIETACLVLPEQRVPALSTLSTAASVYVCGAGMYRPLPEFAATSEYIRVDISRKDVLPPPVTLADVPIIQLFAAIVNSASHNALLQYEPDAIPGIQLDNVPLLKQYADSWETNLKIPYTETTPVMLWCEYSILLHTVWKTLQVATFVKDDIPSSKFNNMFESKSYIVEKCVIHWTHIRTADVVDAVRCYKLSVIDAFYRYMAPHCAFQVVERKPTWPWVLGEVWYDLGSFDMLPSIMTSLYVQRRAILDKGRVYATYTDLVAHFLVHGIQELRVAVSERLSRGVESYTNAYLKIMTVDIVAESEQIRAVSEKITEMADYHPFYRGTRNTHPRNYKVLSAKPSDHPGYIPAMLHDYFELTTRRVPMMFLYAVLTQLSGQQLQLLESTVSLYITEALPVSIAERGDPLTSRDYDERVRRAVRALFTAMLLPLTTITPELEHIVNSRSSDPRWTKVNINRASQKYYSYSTSSKFFSCPSKGGCCSSRARASGMHSSSHLYFLVFGGCGSKEAVAVHACSFKPHHRNGKLSKTIATMLVPPMQRGYQSDFIGDVEIRY